MDCVFCAIVQGKVPAFVVYEDEDLMAILDIYPAVPGHTLIFPKRHIERFWELPDEIVGKIFVLAKYISKRFIEIGAEGVNIFVASGEVAGQRIPHVVVHVIPRYKNDNIKFEWERKQVEPKLLSEILKKIKFREEKKKEEKKILGDLLYWFERNI